MKPPAVDPVLNIQVREVRGQRVVLDGDLAALYSVPTKAFNQAVRRNASRFPTDFAFQLTLAEVENLKRHLARSTLVLRSQSVTLKADRRGRHRKYLPWVFTEHGAIMAAMVLRSRRAVAMSVFVVRAFFRMREGLATGAVILRRLAEVDRKLLVHDVVLRDIYAKLRPLLRPPARRRREIGFHTALKGA